MKKLDFKSLIIGFLMTVIFFLITGLSNIKEGVFDLITVKHVNLIDENGKTMLLLTSNPYGGMMGIRNKNSKENVSLAASEEGGGMEIYDKNGKQKIFLVSSESITGMVINNKHEKKVATIMSNIDQDGGIILMDRYGDVGWVQSGKK